MCNNIMTILSYSYIVKHEISSRDSDAYYLFNLLYIYTNLYYYSMNYVIYIFCSDLYKLFFLPLQN